MWRGATRKKDSYFKAKYHKLASGRGKKKALVAIGHKIIVAAYFIIQDKEAYRKPKQRKDSFSKDRIAKYHLKQLTKSGFEVSKKHVVPTSQDSRKIGFLLSELKLSLVNSNMKLIRTT